MKDILVFVMAGLCIPVITQECNVTCHEDAICEFTTGTCSCKEGFVGDGFMCNAEGEIESEKQNALLRNIGMYVGIAVPSLFLISSFIVVFYRCCYTPARREQVERVPSAVMARIDTIMDEEISVDHYSLQGSDFNIPDADLKVDNQPSSHCSFS